MAADSRITYHSRVPLWRDVRVYRIAVQVVFIIAIVLALGWLYGNMLTGLARMGSSFSFAFLNGSSSFTLAETSLPFDSGDSYAYAFIVAIVNTLKVVIVAIVLTTILGLVMGIARLSSNWLIAQIAQAYVELFRNTPLLLQLFFWYFIGILKLPRVRDSVQLFGSIFLSNRGFYVPWLDTKPTVRDWLPYVAIAFGIALIVYIILARIPRLRAWRSVIALIVFLGYALGNAIILQPFTPTVPELQGFNFAGGTRLSGEYVALVIGLVMYTGAFVAEIVRAGILAVPRGLNEASRALGLNYFQTLRLVTVPLALRVIIPPLTNQYLNLAKNSSLAIVVAYPDAFYVGQLIFNQTGQTVQVVVLVMMTYLVISLLIAAIMDRVNARVRLVEH